MERYPHMSLAERKRLLNSNKRQATKMMLDMAVRQLKDAYSVRYERTFRKRCIWRWMNRADNHWRELARMLIDCEAEFDAFMDFAWECKPTAYKHPPLSWMKSMLTIERFMSYQPDGEAEQTTPWHMSREYAREVRRLRRAEWIADVVSRAKP